MPALKIRKFVLSAGAKAVLQLTASILTGYLTHVKHPAAKIANKVLHIITLWGTSPDHAQWLTIELDQLERALRVAGNKQPAHKTNYRYMLQLLRKLRALVHT